MVGALKDEDLGLLDDERDIYVEILHLALTFMGEHKEGLLMEGQLLKVNKENAPKMEVEPLPPHPCMNLLAPIEHFPLSLVLSLMTPNLINCCVCFKSIRVLLVIVLKISRGLGP